jgi:thiamine-monophosphate kinase
MTDGVSPLMHALSDGEDFELLFTVAAANGPRLLRDWQDATPIRCIGRVTVEKGCWLERDSDQRESLPPLGWSHSLKD